MKIQKHWMFFALIAVFFNFQVPCFGQTNESENEKQDPIQIEIPTKNELEKNFYVRKSTYGTLLKFRDLAVPYCVGKNDEGILVPVNRGWLFEILSGNPEGHTAICLPKDTMLVFMGVTNPSYYNKIPLEVLDRVRPFFYGDEGDLEYALPTGNAVIFKIVTTVDPNSKIHPNDRTCNYPNIITKRRGLDTLQSYSPDWGPFMRIIGCYLMITEGGQDFTLTQSTFEVEKLVTDPQFVPNEKDIINGN